jgi:hypothetical protein
VEAFIKFEEALKEVTLLLQETKNAFDHADNSKTSSEKAIYLFKANTFSRSGIVLLCGHFEGFLKELLQEFLSKINDAKIKPELLPYSLLEEVLKIMIKRCDSGENHRQKLRELMSGQSCIEINEKIQEEFSSTGGNPTVDTIEKMLNRIGIKNVVEQLSVRDFGETSHAQNSQIDDTLKSQIREIISIQSFDNFNVIERDIIDILENKWRPRSKRREVGYVRTIQQLLVKRNEIAHGNSDLKLTKEEFHEFIEEIQKLASGINELTQNQLETLCNNSN